MKTQTLEERVKNNAIDYLDAKVIGKPEDVRFIVKSVNNHASLLEACRACDIHLASYIENDIDCEDAVNALKQLRQAIHKAQ